MPELPLSTTYMRLTDSAGNVIAQNLLVQLDTVNIPWNLEAQSLVPTDWYDLFSVNWTSPVPARGYYFVDQSTGTKYSVFGLPAVYVDHLEVRVTKYSGTTP